MLFDHTYSFLQNAINPLTGVLFTVQRTKGENFASLYIDGVRFTSMDPRASSLYPGDVNDHGFVSMEAARLCADQMAGLKMAWKMP